MGEKKLKWGELEQKGLSNVIKKYNPKQQGEFINDKQRLKCYVSGSIYAGEWSTIDMEGVGTYILPHGVVYEGTMKNGMFHGKGILIYPMGQIIVGEWYEGEITSWKFKYKDIEQCTLETYCKQPDRRFLTTLYNELLPASKEYLTNEQPTRKIPEACYDVVDGFYNPKTLWVHSSKNFARVLYMPAPRRIPGDVNIFQEDGSDFLKKLPFVPIFRTSKWIEENCRKAWDEPTGHRPDLYEYWYSGRKSHAKRLDMKVESQGGRFVWSESFCDEMLRNFENWSQRQMEDRQIAQFFLEADEKVEIESDLPSYVSGVEGSVDKVSDIEKASGDTREDNDSFIKKYFDLELDDL